MEKVLYFNNYQALAERTANRGEGETDMHRFANFGMGIAGEAGEVCGRLEGVVRGVRLDVEKIKKELGDALWYTAALATTAGFFLSDVARHHSSLDDYQALVRSRTFEQKPRELDEREALMDELASRGLLFAARAGETCDYLKKVVFHGHDLNRDKLKRDLGRVLWSIAVIATATGLSLSDIATANIEKLKARYPEGFDPERSINRKEGES